MAGNLSELHAAIKVLLECADFRLQSIAWDSNFAEANPNIAANAQVRKLKESIRIRQAITSLLDWEEAISEPEIEREKQLQLWINP